MVTGGSSRNLNAVVSVSNEDTFTLSHYSIIFNTSATQKYIFYVSPDLTESFWYDILPVNDDVEDRDEPEADVPKVGGHRLLSLGRLELRNGVAVTCENKKRKILKDSTLWLLCAFILPENLSGYLLWNSMCILWKSCVFWCSGVIVWTSSLTRVRNSAGFSSNSWMMKKQT